MNDSINEAIQYLRNNDKILRRLIDKNGKCNLVLSNNYFNDLVSSIISQQLSVKAANSIFNKVKSKLSSISPEIISYVDIEILKSSGLSNNKAKFVKNLSDYFLSNPDLVKSFPDLHDDQIIVELCKVKGIGLWTAQMFLIFSLNRLNILPLNDVAFKRSIVKNYELQNTVDLEKQIIQISYNWGNYKSIAAWYLWKELDNN